jgi:hypothetical protein
VVQLQAERAKVQDFEALAQAQQEVGGEVKALNALCSRLTAAEKQQVIFAAENHKLSSEARQHKAEVQRLQAQLSDLQTRFTASANREADVRAQLSKTRVEARGFSKTQMSEEVKLTAARNLIQRLEGQLETSNSNSMFLSTSRSAHSTPEPLGENIDVIGQSAPCPACGCSAMLRVPLSNTHLLCSGILTLSDSIPNNVRSRDRAGLDSQGHAGVAKRTTSVQRRDVSTSVDEVKKKRHPRTPITIC